MERIFSLLIIDDEKEILNTYESFFKKRNFAVEVAKDGVEGLTKLTKHDFDVAIVDLNMPRKTGLEMINEAFDKGVDASFIVLTGHGDKDDAVKAINTGVDGWFEKSGINMRELLDKVTELSSGPSSSEISKMLSSIPED